MKKARQIELPDDRPLTPDEFQDFKSHAINSSTWYATEYSRSEKQVVDKLLAKGYIRDDVYYVDKAGEEKSANIIDDVLEYLREYSLVNDEAYARGLISRYSSSRRGASYTRNKLIEKGVSSELADELLEELRDEDEVYDAIDSLAERYMFSSAYTRIEDEYKRRQKLTSHLLSRGYSFGDIRDWQDRKALEE